MSSLAPSVFRVSTGQEFDDLAQHAKHVLRSVGIVPVDGVSWGKRVAADVERRSAHDTEEPKIPRLQH